MRRWSNKICKLEKALYYLRESPRAWYECLNKFLINLVFRRSNIDYSLYTFKKEINIIYLLVYVDDLLIYSMSKEKIQQTKKPLSDKFEMKDLGEIKEYLGINVEYDCYKNEIKRSQTKYIEPLIKKYKLRYSKLYNTPLETNLKIEKDDVGDIMNRKSTTG
jgi:hypothetical protein